MTSTKENSIANTLASASKEIRELIIHQAERAAQDISDAKQAIDQRGAVMAAAFLPTGTAGLGLFVNGPVSGFSLFALGAGVGFVVAAALALYSIRPTRKWDPVAQYPKDWIEDIQGNVSIENIEGEMLANFNDGLKTNNSHNAERNKWQFWAFGAAIAGPVAGFILSFFF